MIEEGYEWLVIDTPIQLKEVSTPDTPYAGKLKLYAKDSGGVSKLFYLGDNGVEVGPLNVGVTDHGGLSGLADDDHTQYVLRSILTTNGDIFVRSGGVISRLGIGTNGQVLKVVTGAPAWGDAAAASDHGDLTGLGDDDHTQYALLNGRGVGQTLIGGVGSGNSLFLRSTSHATKGGIILGDASGGSIHPTLTNNWHQFYKNSASDGPTVQIANNQVTSGGSIGSLEFGSRGASASDKRAALIHVALDAAGSTNPTGRMEFYVNNAGSFIESLRLSSNGDINHSSSSRHRMLSQNRFRHLNCIARATKITSAQTLTHDTLTVITLNSETFDTDTIHDNSTNNTRLSAPIAGKYLVLANVEFANGSDSTQRLVAIRQDGTTIYGQQRFVAENGDVSVCSTSAVVSLAAAGYVEMVARHKKGSDLAVSATENTSLAMYYIGE